MRPLFQITSEMIRQMNDVQARELVARLCRAEMHSGGYSESLVTWGGEQRAPDGGIDVRVSNDALGERVGFVPRQESGFQVKAEIFGPAKIKREMSPDGCLRPVISELASKNGAYIIVSTKENASDEPLRRRLRAMKECLDSGELGDTPAFDFYDSRRVADWVEQHPIVAEWMLNELGHAHSGWRTYGPWAYLESHTESNFLIDGEVRAYVPGSGKPVTIIEAIITPL